MLAQSQGAPGFPHHQQPVKGVLGETDQEVSLDGC